jgi:hypothetical protein
MRFLLALQAVPDAAQVGFSSTFLIFWCAVAILAIAGMWKVFEKAGEPGWAAIVPIYNAWVLLRIARQPWWMMLLFLIPLINIIVILLVGISVAKNFGRGAAFGLGLTFLGFIFYPILGFGDARYQAS